MFEKQGLNWSSSENKAGQTAKTTILQHTLLIKSQLMNLEVFSITIVC